MAAFARREAEEARAKAAAWNIDLSPAVPLEKPRPAAPPIPVPSTVHYEFVPPSFDDLYALFVLHGGSEPDVVETLAKVWGCAPLAIAETVRSWLSSMPALPPPSRMRSAPAIVSPALQARLASAAPHGHFLPAPAKSILSWRSTAGTDVQGTTMPMGTAQRILLPWERKAAVRRAVGGGGGAAGGGAAGGVKYSGPAAAPVIASAPVKRTEPMFNLDMAMSGLHSTSTRLHATRGGSGSSDLPLHRQSANVYTLPSTEPIFAPVRLTAAQIASVPEDTILDHFEEDALAAFMARTSSRIEVSTAQAYTGYRFRF